MYCGDGFERVIKISPSDWLSESRGNLVSSLWLCYWISVSFILINRNGIEAGISRSSGARLTSPIGGWQQFPCSLPDEGRVDFLCGEGGVGPGVGLEGWLRCWPNPLVVVYARGTWPAPCFFAPSLSGVAASFGLCILPFIICPSCARTVLGPFVVSFLVLVRREAWHAVVHGVAKIPTRLGD